MLNRSIKFQYVIGFQDMYNNVTRVPNIDLCCLIVNKHQSHCDSSYAMNNSQAQIKSMRILALIRKILRSVENPFFYLWTNDFIGSTLSDMSNSY